jgi:hypothetical protein
MSELHQDALINIALLCKLRARRWAEEDIAKKLEFGSAEALHIQLRNWSLPGLLPNTDATSQTDLGHRTGGKKPRSARTASEEPIELLPAYGARDLFHAALEKLGWSVIDLQNRREYLQDGRFVAQEDTSAGNSSESGIAGETLTVPLGASQVPREPLPALIAAYLLAEEPLEPLLEKLNCRPEAVDREQIRALIEGEKTPRGHKRGLKSIVGLIARGIRGGKIKPGRDTGEVTEHIQNGVWYSRQLSERNLPPETISARLREAGFTKDEIDNIRSLHKIPKPQ